MVSEIRTARDDVILRPLTLDDAEAYFNAVDEDRAHLSQFNDVTADNYPTVSEVEASIIRPPNPAKRRYGIWHNGTFAGSINLTPYSDLAEVGYWIRKSSVGQGLARAATRALTLNMLTEFDTIYASVMKGNKASQAVLEASGFVVSSETDERINYQFEA